MKTKSAECEKKLPAAHRVPKYFSLYKGRDGWHSPYNGKFANMILAAGEGAYREKDFDQEPAFVAGV